MHYAISPDGLAVLSYKSKTAAAAKAVEIGGHFASDATETDTGLTAVPTPLLIVLHNLIRPERPVSRFSDRATAEKRLKGVLEVLSKPGTPPAETEPAGEEVPEVEEVEEEYIPDPALSAEENEVARAAKKAARKSAKKKGGAKKRAAKATVSNITDATVRRVIKMRADGTGWPEILKTLGEGNNFIHRVRPLMKALDRSSVLKRGPGSPNYGKAKKK